MFRPVSRPQNSDIMKKIVFVYALLATVAAWAGCVWGRMCSDEARRERANVRVLNDSMVRYRTRMNEEAASVEALQLRCSEYARMREEDARRIRDMGIRLRRLESTSRSVVETRVEVRTELRDTVAIAGGDCSDTLQTVPATVFEWSDGWVSVEGRIAEGMAECHVASIDTLRQIVHRVPRRFLFIRFGTKAIRQEIVSSNPHTSIVAAEYIEFPQRRVGKRTR